MTGIGEGVVLRPLASLPRPARRAVWLVVLATAAALVLGWLAVTKTIGRDTLASTADLRAQRSASLAATLTRAAQLGDGDAQVILASPTFFKLTSRQAEGTRLGADRFLVFVVNENSHFTDLPHRFAPVLRLDGTTLAVPTEVRVLTDAVHHRTSAVIFGDVPATLVDGDHSLELLLPPSADGARPALAWRTPVAYPDDVRDPAGLSLGLVLSLGAGLLAAISPCLLQLSAFYLPTLAGVSADASTRMATRRARLVPIAATFVLGFTIPYTAGGAAMGAFGGWLAASGLLSPTGPIAEGAGIVMIGMAVLVAFRARAPLACELPLPATLRRGRLFPFVEAFVSGFAIATGCLACFGGAILGVLLVYTGLLGSPLLGGLAMLAFSLGLAIPFLLAAFSLSRAEPFVLALQRATPVVGLATSLAMLFFGITMATGNYHVVSGWLAQHLPLG